LGHLPPISVQKSNHEFGCFTSKTEQSWSAIEGELRRFQPSSFSCEDRPMNNRDFVFFGATASPSP
jgi:hypothetical protein